ncbi:DsbA family protein [Candidatus Woesearchaeota archaeon]|nr:MAG: DsbA family protein [Candidatus Woesearchaeota archaeon]
MVKQRNQTQKEDTTLEWTKIVLLVIQAILLFALVLQVRSLGGIATAPTNAESEGNTQVQAPPTQTPPTQPQPGGEVDLKALMDDDPVKGNPDAPVTIVEFSDYQCPFCGRHFQQTYPQLVKDYIDTGKVKLVYRDFPLSFHPEAQKAAEAAECAGEQGKYWEMHDKLFQNQQSLGVANYKKWARELGLDGSKFDTCLDSGKMANEVKKDMADGQAAGVRGTPSFFINGRPVRGAQPFSVFQGIIEDELAKQ